MNENEVNWLNEIKRKIEVKMAMVSTRSADKIPTIAINGVHDDKRIQKEGRHSNKLQWWTNGFWGGIMWLIYQDTKKEKYKEIAQNNEIWLDEALSNYWGLHHDVGFMWQPTSVIGYKLTDNFDSKRRALHAANILAGRFNPFGHFIRAWNDSESVGDLAGWTIVDCMMNLSILYWASEETKDPRFSQIASIHADKVVEHYIREDGSSNHIVEFNPNNGELIQTFGGQGYKDGSAWSRGQGWALYGMMISYHHTGKKIYLETAQKVANFIVQATPKSGLIPSDFRQPPESNQEDTIATSVIACGMIELSRALGVETYIEYAIKILKILDTQRCDWNVETDCILQQATALFGSTPGDSQFVYGDFFFIEAIFKLIGVGIFMW